MIEEYERLHNNIMIVDNVEFKKKNVRHFRCVEDMEHIIHLCTCCCLHCRYKVQNFNEQNRWNFVPCTYNVSNSKYIVTNGSLSIMLYIYMYEIQVHFSALSILIQCGFHFCISTVIINCNCSYIHYTHI